VTAGRHRNAGGRGIASRWTPQVLDFKASKTVAQGLPTLARGMR
jgi:hypothetical protein